MADLIIRGRVEPDGRLVLEQEKVDLPPGSVEIHIHPKPKTYSVTIEEAKRLLAQERQFTDEEWAEISKLHQSHLAVAEDLGLPEDYADEIDHYLYGTPKRSQNG